MSDDATFAYNNEGYTIGGGEVTLNHPDAADGNTKNSWFDDGLKLHIEAAGQLTIAQYNFLVIRSNDNGGPIVTGDAGGKIVITGYITFFARGGKAKPWPQSGLSSSRVWVVPPAQPHSGKPGGLCRNNARSHRQGRAPNRTKAYRHPGPLPPASGLLIRSAVVRSIPI